MSETLKLTVLTGALVVGATLAAAPMAFAERGDTPRGASFEELDANGDGALTEAEMQAHRAARFAAMVSDGNGSLNADELTAAAAQRQAKRAARMIERVDANGDGELSAQELAEMGNMRRGGDRFGRLDTDRDGVVTTAEFDAAKDKRRAFFENRRSQNDG